MPSLSGIVGRAVLPHRMDNRHHWCWAKNKFRELLFWSISPNNQDEDNRGTDEEGHMHKIIKDKKDDIAEICRKYDVIRLEVFGSAARGTDFDPNTSDVDFLIDFRNPLKADYCKRYDGVEEDLKELFARKVDLVRIGTIRNPYRLASIEEDREMIYEE